MDNKSNPDPPQSSAPPPDSQPHPSGVESDPKKPVAIICIGMAGSGKTTLLQRLNSYLHTNKTPPYVLNLDPAVTSLPYTANIDIRDTINYKQVMESYNLGPNGGILTALNLFTTKFDQVLDILEKRSGSIDHILIDTPGQIEIFTWSASGSIITEAIASTIPTVIAYVIDTPRTTAPATFMSNMLYACSILYKTRLPFILVFNKIDAQSHDFALSWMSDFQLFQAALHSPASHINGEPSYMNSLMSSMCLVLDEFYTHLSAVGVSAMTGEGIEGFFEKVEEKRQEWERDYRPELERVAKDRADKKQADKTEQLARLMKDMQTPGASSSTSALGRGAGAGTGRGDNPFGPYPRNDREDAHYDEEGSDEDEDDDDDEDDMENDDEFGPDAEIERPFPGRNETTPGAGAGAAGSDRTSGWQDGASWPRPS